MLKQKIEVDAKMAKQSAKTAAQERELLKQKVCIGPSLSPSLEPSLFIH